MAVNLASKYSDKIVERFKIKALTEAAVNHDFEWTGVNTLSVYSIPTAPMNNYTRSGNARYGTANELDNTKQDMIVTRDRSFTFTIDRGNFNDTMMANTAGKSLARQLDEVVIPEVDIYRLATMSAAAIAAGGVATTAVTATNAYSVFLDGQSYFSDNKVPLQGRIAFVTPAFYKFLKLDNSFIKASDLAQNMLVKGQVGEVDGTKIVLTPTSYLPANHAFVLSHPAATVAAEKLEDYKTHDNPPGINGWLVEGRTIYDAFVLTQKNKALYVHKIA